MTPSLFLRAALLAALALTAGPLSAQPLTALSVTAPDGSPIPAASVAVLSSTRGTATDDAGRFRLLLPPTPFR